jgi:NAD-dependent deacetylase
MTGQDLSSQIHRAVELIHAADHAVVITGAGMSTPSGIPDFRSAGSGLWTQDNPMLVASLTAFRRHPERFFNWLRSLAKPIWEAQPNPAHFALAEMENNGYLQAVITQNIDGLHQKGGSHKVIELHGSLNTLTCPRCRSGFQAEDFFDVFIRDGDLPYCPDCKSLLKPDIILFEEALPMEAWNIAQDHCEQADLVLIAGSSLEVSPANQLPLYSLQHNASLIINTLSPTYLDEEAQVLLPGNVAEILPQIAAQLNAKQHE